MEKVYEKIGVPKEWNIILEPIGAGSMCFTTEDKFLKWAKNNSYYNRDELYMGLVKLMNLSDPLYRSAVFSSHPSARDIRGIIKLECKR